MKNLDVAILFTKGLCIVGSTILLSLSTSLGQWGNSETTPSKVEWCIILGGSIGAGLTSLHAFLSTSFSNYMKNGAAPPEPPKP